MSLVQRFSQLPAILKRRVGFLWSINALYQFGFLLAWVVITSLFIEKFGINNLLILFFLEAVLILIGSVMGRSFFLRYKDNDFLFGVLALLSLIILGAFYVRENSQIFFLLAIVGKSLVYPQLRIGLLRKIESFFSPNEGRKAIPVIESAETIGTIVSALVIVALLKIFTAQQVLYLWLVPIALIAVGLLRESHILQKVKEFHTEQTSYRSFSKNFFRGQRGSKKKFQQALLAFILFQSALFGVVEYEFTKEVNTDFTAHHEELEMDWEHFQASMFGDTVKKVQESVETSAEHLKEEVTKFTTADIAQTNIAHDLGVLSLLFGMIALVFKLAITAKLIKKLGPFRTIILYFSGFLAAAIALIMGKTNMHWVRGYEHSCVSLFASPYHLSFYSTNSKDREFLRHFLEGIIKPIGIILGIGMIMVVYKLGSHLNALVFSLVLASLILAWKLRQGYEKYMIQNFFATDNIEEKIHLLEVLSGARKPETIRILADYLVNETAQPLALRKKIIDTLNIIGNPQVIHQYFSLLNESKENEEIKIRILDSLLHFPKLRKYCDQKAFTEVRFLETLQNLFESTHNRHLRKIIIMNLFANISNEKIVSFLRSILQHEDPELIAVCLRSFKDLDDPEIVSEIRPYLTHQNSRIRSHAIMALWKFESKPELREKLLEMLRSDMTEEKISAVYALGELQDKNHVDLIEGILEGSTGFLRAHILIALLKLGNRNYMEHLIPIITGKDELLAKQAFHMRKRLPSAIREQLEVVVQKQVSAKIQTILDTAAVHDQNDLRKLPDNIKYLLQRLYGLVGSYENIYLIQNSYGRECSLAKN